MISKEQLQEIAKRAGVSAEVLTQAISSDKEEKIELPAVHIYTDDELATLKLNLKKEGYTEGKEAGVEMKFKEIRDAFKVEGVEGKDFMKLMDKFKADVLADAKAEPSKKINELTEDLRKLQASYHELEQLKNNEVNSLKSTMDKVLIDSTVKSLLPDSAGGLDREDLATLYYGKRQIKKTETGFEIIDVKNNEILKDKTQNPVSLQDDIKAFLEGRKTPPEGRGGKDQQNYGSSGVESIKSRTQAEAYFEKNKIPIAERASILAKAMKNEGFDMAR